MAETARIAEVFSSLQGEGLYVGERQIFIRFIGCNLACQYCDTPLNSPEMKPARVELTSGKKDFKEYPNPMSLEQVLEIVAALHKVKNLHHSVSLTGGEPLLQVDFLKELIPRLTEKDLLTYLETNGTLPNHLKEIINLIDIVVMDFKLSSATGLSSYMREHKEFLQIAAQREVMVKAVFTRETQLREIEEMTEMISQVNPKIPLVLQPVTPYGPVKHRPYPQEILAFQTFAKRKLQNVRVIPQIHKLLGLL